MERSPEDGNCDFSKVFVLRALSLYFLLLDFSVFETKSVRPLEKAWVEFFVNYNILANIPLS